MSARLRVLGLLALLLAVAAGAAGEQVESKTKVQNKAPSVVEVDLDGDDDASQAGVQVAPVPGGDRLVRVQVRSQDDNGHRDVEDLEVEVFRPDGSRVAGPVRGDEGERSGRTVEHSASFSLAHFEPPGTYAVRATATDKKGGTDTQEATFEYLALLAFSLDRPAVEFDAGELAPGSTTHGAPSPLGVTNQGNVPFDLQVSGTDLAALGVEDASIPASRVKYSSAPDMAGEAGLGADPLVDAAFSLAPGAGSVRQAYFDVHVPTGEEQFVPAATYVGAIRVGAVADQGVGS